MKFLIIEQDLRVSGSSQGIISRSFLAKLRKSYPKSVIDVLYLKHSNSDDDLHLLPVDNIETHVVNSIDVLYDAIGEYAIHIEDSIMDLEKVFPTLGKDWGIYMPEVKYLSHT